MDYRITCFDGKVSELSASETVVKIPNIRKRLNRLLLVAVDWVSNMTISRMLKLFYSGSKPVHLFIKPHIFITQLGMPLPLG